MSLADYQRLVADLSLDGNLGRPLKTQITTEARAADLSITSPPGTSVDSPSFLTPAMNAWYRTHVAGVRRTAVTRFDMRLSRTSTLEVEVSS